MMMIEARRSERIRSYLRARIVYNNNSSTIDCTVKNISPSGAKIELGDAMSIPDAFDLEIPQKGRSYRARLTWRNESAIGVEFVDGDPLERKSGKVERLESDVRRLKTIIAQLTKRLEDLGQDVSLT